MINKIIRFVKNIFKKEDIMNSNLTNYLDYYTKLEKPGYALLITGGWGSGKTYQINKYFEKKQDNICYVSLFGIGSIQDIYSSIFIKMFPKKAFLKKMLGKIDNVDTEFSTITLGLGGLLSNLGSSLIKENVDNKKIIILDDLERAIRNNIISIDDILGVINNYIEHNGCKVIVIAHDEKILSELSEKREKVFGQTIKIEPDIDNAVTTFLYQKKIYHHFPEIKNILETIHLQSGYSSLRVLKYVINDCERLFSYIREINLNKEQLGCLFRYFITSCIELKSEKLTFDDYIDHFNVRLNYSQAASENEGVEKHILIQMLEKYENFKLDNELISQESIVRIVKDGYFDKKIINEYIKNSNLMKEQPDTPSWYKLTYLDRISDEEIDEALIELHDDFDNRKFYLLGDISHMISFLLLEEKTSNTEPNYEKIERDCIGYIDDLFIQGKLEKRNPNKYYEETDTNSYNGVSYWIEEDYRLYSNQLRNYLDKKSYELFNKDASKYNIIEKMKVDLDSLLLDCTRNNSNYGEFSEIPLFHTISPIEFVSTWLSLPNIEQQKISNMFKRRYSIGALNSTLADEKEWIRDVFSELDRAASSMEHIHKYRVERLKMRIPTE